MVDLTGGGVRVPPNDAPALAQALADLHDDPQRADRLGAAARAGAHEHFTADVAARQMEGVYERMLL